jgi:hypothetical protein
MNRARMTRILLILGLTASMLGCQWAPLRHWWPHRAPCAISPSISKEHLVQHLNRNIQGTTTSSGIASWRCTNVKITATGMPPGISVPATIAVEAPRNLRLRVSEPLTRVEALDMGSNAEEFWFWAKDAHPPQVVTISHSDLPAAQRELHVPFDPDWLMEVLGVIPLDPAKVTLTSGRVDAPTLELISQTPTVDGTPIKKVVRVDACTGFIREHALYDSRGVLIARAALGDHHIDPQTGLVMPRVISFDWPAMHQSMKLVLGTVELNPSSTPASVWQVPHKPGAPRFDLSQVLGTGGRQHASPYGAASPFGIVPPRQQPASFQSAPSGDTGTAQPASSAQTTFEPGVWWQDEGTESIQRVSREHLSRRNVSPAEAVPQ